MLANGSRSDGIHGPDPPPPPVLAEDELEGDQWRPWLGRTCIFLVTVWTKFALWP